MNWNAEAYLLWLPKGAQAPAVEKFTDGGVLFTHAIEALWIIAGEKAWGSLEKDGWLMAKESQLILSPSDLNEVWPDVQKLGKLGRSPYY